MTKVSSCLTFNILFFFLFLYSYDNAVGETFVPQIIEYSTFSPNASEITFGCTMAMTGDSPFSSYGKQLMNSIDMWFWWVNVIHGGINIGGKTFRAKLKWLDNKGNESLVSEMTAYLINNGSSIMFSPYSTTLTGPASAVSEKRGVITVTGGAAGTSIFLGKRFLFSTLSPADVFMISGLKTLVMKGARTIVNVIQQLAFTVDMGASIGSFVQRTQATALGLQITHEIKLSASPDEEEINSLILNLSQQEQKPDVFVGCVYFSVCTAILKAAKEFNYLPGSFIMSLCVDDPNFVNTVGVDNERYIIGAVQWNENRPLQDDNTLTGWTAHQFADIFRSRYNMSPSYFAAAYFASGLAITKALENCLSLDSTEIAFALGRLNLETFFGSVMFDSNGQGTEEYLYIQYNDVGTLEIVAPDLYATSNVIYPSPEKPMSSAFYQQCLADPSHGPRNCHCSSVGCPLCVQQDFNYTVSQCFTHTTIRLVSHHRVLDCEGGFALPSPVQIDCDQVPFQSPMGITVQAFAYIGGLLGFFFVVWTMWYRKSQVLKTSQPEFIGLLGLGGLVCSLSPLILLGSITTTKCQAHPWVFHCSFTVMIGSIFVKTYRIWRIFECKKFAHVIVTTKDSFRMLAIILSFLVFILGLWFILYAPTKISVWKTVPSVGSVQNSSCTTASYFIAIIVFVEVAVVLLACFFSFQIRKVPDNFSETQYIMLAVYSITFIFGVASIVAYLSDRNSLKILLHGISTSLSCTIAMGALFLPKLIIQYHEYHVQSQQTEEAGGGAVERNMYLMPRGSQLNVVLVHSQSELQRSNAVFGANQNPDFFKLLDNYNKLMEFSKSVAPKLDVSERAQLETILSEL